MIFLLSAKALQGASDDDIVSAVKTAVIPIIEQMEQAFNEGLLLESEKKTMYWACDTSALERGDILKRFQAYKLAIEGNFMQADEILYKEDMPALGLNWIRLGLDDVLYDPKTKTIYTPNTNASVKVGEGGIAAGDEEKRMWLKGEHGYFAGSTPGGGGGGTMYAPDGMTIQGGTAKGNSSNNNENDVDKLGKDDIIKYKDEIIADFKSTNFNGEIHIPPREIDINSLSYDKRHIMDGNHDVNLKSARQYIKNAKISVTRTVEGDEFENYYGDKGATYVNITKNLIRTSFPKKEFNEGTDRILDTVNKHLKKKE